MFVLFAYFENLIYLFCFVLFRLFCFLLFVLFYVE